MDSYANTPKTITELRADKMGKSEFWTPRDCLIAMLRDIDSGKFSPKQIVIVAAVDTETGSSSNVTNSVAGPFTTFECLGLLYKAQQIMLEP